MPYSADKLKRLRAKLHSAMRADRVGLLRELGKLQGTRKPEELEQGIARLERRLAAAASKKERRRSSLPRVSIPAALPIASRRADIIEAIRKNPVVIITGETGSGKTTQIPKMCIEAGRGVDGRDGKAVFKVAVVGMADVSEEIMKRNNLKSEDVAWLVPHQANLRIIDATAHRMGIDRSKVMINIDRYGNSTAATIPLCLSEWWEAGRLRKGQKIVMSSFGAGYTWGAILMEWTMADATGA